MPTVIEYIDEAIAGFDRDLADSDYQCGFLDALKTVRAEAALPEIERLRDTFASIKEFADSDETLLIWQTADEELKCLEQVQA